METHPEDLTCWELGWSPDNDEMNVRISGVYLKVLIPAVLSGNFDKKMMRLGGLISAPNRIVVVK